MSAIVEILIFLDYLSAVPDVCFNDTEIFFWILLDNFSAVPDASAEGYDVSQIDFILDSELNYLKES